MSCNSCEILFDQDCESEECKEQRRLNRQSLFDYMLCKQMEDQFKDTDNVDL